MDEPEGSIRQRATIRRVLVVDDDEDILTIIRSALEHRGYRVTAVGSGGEAVEAAQRLSFDLLITNMILSDIRGTEVIEGVGKSHPAVFIIVASGEPEAEAEAMEIGVERFLPKPFRIEELRRMVEEALGEEWRRL